MNLEEFVVEGQVRASASMFPVLLEASSAGQSPARFIVMQHPDHSWWAAGWVSSRTGGDPDRILLTKVLEIQEFTSSRVAMLTEAGHVIVTPSGGGCCGNRLKGWNPFGPGVQLAHVPATSMANS